MNEYKPTPEEESARRRADNDREGQAECAAALAASAEAPPKSAGPVGSLGVVGGSNQPPRTSEDDELRGVADIANEACSEEQPMPLGTCDAELVAAACEVIADRHAGAREWRKATIALRMACWYYGKALAG